MGTRHIPRIKERLTELRAKIAHEFMNCLGVESIAFNAQLALMAGRERRESRKEPGVCECYVDYPKQDRKYDYTYCSSDVFGIQKKGATIPEIRYSDECWHCNSCVLECRRKALSLRVPLNQRMFFVDTPEIKERRV